MNKLIGGMTIALLLVTTAACSLQKSGATSTATSTAQAVTLTPTAPGAIATSTGSILPIGTETPGIASATPITGTLNLTPGLAQTQAALTPGQVTTAPAAPPSGGGSPAADKYQYMGQNVPDGKQYRPGTTVSITWTIKNIGSTTWTSTYILRFFAGPPGATPQVLQFGQTVAPGKNLNLTITVPMPNTLGDYDTWYKLTNDQMQNFGDLDFKYTVTNEPTNKIQPTATP